MSKRRYSLYGQCLIVLLAGTCFGQLNSNVWPAYLHSRNGIDQMSDCYSSLWERASALYNNPVSILGAKPSTFRFQRTNLQTLKTKTSSILSYGKWVCPTNTYGQIIQIINSSTNKPDSSYVDTNGVLSIPEFLIYCQLPTNFLNYTPYRGLDGVGPYTNDYSVGHPHGWTNTSTMAGGTWFPPGRSNWYTTDYGWDGLLCLITNMQKRNINLIGAWWNDSPGARGEGNSTNSYDEAQAIAEGAITNVSGVGFNWYSGKQEYSDSGDGPFYYNIRTPILNYAVQLPTNGVEPIAQGIFQTWTIRTGENYTNTVFGYDGTQLGYTNKGAWFTNDIRQTVWGWQSEPATNIGNLVMKFYIGGTNQIPLAPTNNSAYFAFGRFMQRGVGLRYEDAWIDYQHAMMFLDYSGQFKFK